MESLKRFVNWFKKLDVAYQLIIGVVVFVIGVSIYAEVVKDEYVSPKKTNYRNYESDEDRKIKACTLAHITIESSLKSPSTADFETCNYNNIRNVGGNYYNVKFWVDSQNSFGAMLRSNCEVELDIVARHVRKVVVNGELVYSD